MNDAALDLPPDWKQALDRASGCRRTLVLGAADMGKSSFIRALAKESGSALGLIDLDPGQKMLGPPGTAGYGRIDERGEARLERFVFLGSTSAASLSAIARAAASLADTAQAQGPFVVNTSGYVRGPGARLQQWTAVQVAADLVVEILDDPAAPPIAPDIGAVPRIRIQRSPFARRKSTSVRAAVRQAAFENALAGASTEALPLDCLRIEPALPAPFAGADRPVCSLADDHGEDMAIAILQDIADGHCAMFAPAVPRPVRTIRLGRMWAAPAAGWRLLDRLSPAWPVEAAA